MERDRHNFFVILNHFFSFYPPVDPENQNFQKMKKALEDVIILQMCTINNSHMMHGSRDMECNGQNFFVILDCFLPFHPLTTWKIKIWKKWKNHLEILSFFTCVHKWQSHDVWFLRYGAWRTKFFCHLDFSCAFTPNNPKNQHFEKIKIKSGDIIMLHMCTIMTFIWCMVSEILNVTNRVFCHFGPLFALLTH